MWNPTEQVQFFESILFETFGQTIEVLEVRVVSGGSINTAVRVFTSEGTFFIKFNHAEQEDMFEKEARGLAILRQTDTLHIPTVPAPYYGFRETEIAFSYLSGDFNDEFYEAYHEAFPLEPDFSSRIPIYNLYPLLVHVNLFGKSYLPPIERLLKRYVGDK